ncbi:MAG: sensor domain-containing diguanylate cyclase [Planctomycetia bacterium]|nr:sensor domain-containing diguanylate cyclase [Planctomycetia bacterium]
MIEPGTPEDESRRLAALKALRILDTPAEERFDRITRTARKLFNVPIALISLVDGDRQWFKSCQGLAVNETSRSVSFCGHAILQDEPLVVADAASDPRFHDNPLVTGDPTIRFYAGCPLRAPDGSKLGTLCLIGREPRTLTGEEVASLQDLAAWAEGEVGQVRLGESQLALIRERDELRRRAMVDALTQLWNRGAVLEILRAEVARAERQRHAISVAMVDGDRFKEINDTHGHPAGDAVLREMAQRLRGALRPYDAVGRYGGEEFIVVLPDCGATAARALGERLREAVCATPFEAGKGSLAVTASVGLATSEPAKPVEPDALVAAADAALYRAKKGGRNRVES